MVVLPVATASADVCDGCYGSRIYSTYQSNGKVIVKEENTTKDLWRYQDSRNTLGFLDVDAFWVPGGCDAYSKYGYRYVGNTWYGITDTVTVELKVIC